LPGAGVNCKWHHRRANDDSPLRSLRRRKTIRLDTLAGKGTVPHDTCKRLQRTFQVIVPTLLRGNAARDAPASRFATWESILQGTGRTAIDIIKLEWVLG